MLRFYAKYPKQEPDALAAYVWICAGVVGNGYPYRHHGINANLLFKWRQ
ncbi:hypothetical protein GP982_23565 [Escherichia coli]|uniref:Uncharacterized protein n=2 Tax=Escherichia TaxID=561 RepID=A0A6D0I2E0_ECOLX|nr:hypothetical protein [Escherichia coli]MEC9628683.1 hypothetical protein [Escherichia marmotae]EJU2552954.1 hypothetical protein [Escherichia coli]KAE9862533.1 hypothetical protein GP667_21595 [Escherichia coli]MDC6786407.1 hypothetical protein [Escherichia coli]MDC6835796.1 hypothetical protein [Escherichia coli]